MKIFVSVLCIACNSLWNSLFLIKINYDNIISICRFVVSKFVKPNLMETKKESVLRFTKVDPCVDI